tara:strand:- start:1389 stop:1766 length:378 start_codon:yes stop_codon:yes gene_type:complete
MGGENEKVVETPRATSAPFGKTAKTVGKIRIHENAGEVHFHDDKKKLKVAVPVADFMERWETFQLDPFRGDSLRLFDSENETAVILQPDNIDLNAPDKPFDVAIYLHKVKLGTAFQALSDFHAGK